MTGAQTDRMTRDDGWRLLSIGRHIERLGLLCHALARGFELGWPHDDGFDGWSALFDSTITFHARYQERREMLPMVDLLVLDSDSNARAGLGGAHAARPPAQAGAPRRRLGLRSHRPVPAPETWSIDEMARPVPRAGRDALIAALHRMVEAVYELSDAIGNHLFAHVTGADRSVWQ